MASSASERSEKPTARRLRDARRKGQVAVSRDLATAAGFCVCPRHACRTVAGSSAAAGRVRASVRRTRGVRS
ncbi:MAG: EscU/YscU/HrcU family type III secretion system export apparatus switch protein [Blastocatellia bacterium]|nr:EscU/YscU/HrcU family type III secretion system export apparatus switch protein [Blastocatellia bacterium]